MQNKTLQVFQVEDQKSKNNTQHNNIVLSASTFHILIISRDISFTRERALLHFYSKS